MNNFKDFNIKPKTESFVGDKRKMSKLLNLEITVHRYKIVPSKFDGSRLDLQIELNGVKMVTWTASNYMVQMIKDVPENGFPFKTIIKEVDEHYEFT
jgi:hypothetical protein